MINHVVLFKPKEFNLEEKNKVLTELQALLEGLKERIKEVKYIEVGLNYQIETKSYDMVLISHFETIEDLDQYRIHPEHLKVLKRINETTDLRAAVDCKF